MGTMDWPSSREQRPSHAGGVDRPHNLPARCRRRNRHRF